MDRDRIMTLLNKFYGEGLSMEEMSEVITSYCKEKGKEDKDISMLILALIVSHEHMLYCLSYAFNYYRRKYNILELYNKQSLNDIVRPRRVILIY